MNGSRAIVAACLAAGLAAVPASSASRDPEAVVILEQAARALRAVRDVSYRFVYGGPSDPTGWVTGEVWMQQVTDAADSRIRVTGVLQAQPEFGATETRFDYATDGERAYLIDHTRRTFESADA